MKTGLEPGLNWMWAGIVSLVLLTSLLSCTADSPIEATPSPPSPSNTPHPPTATPPPGPEPGWTRFSAADAIAEMRNLQAIAIAPSDHDDNAPTLWVGTDRGIYQLEGETWKQHTALGRGISVDVLSLVVGPAGGIWAGTREGLTRFDGQTWTPYRRRDYCKKAYCPKLRWLFAIAVAPDGALWLADGWKLHRFDGAIWTTHKPYLNDDDERSHDVRALAITPGGDVWFATAAGAFLLEEQALALAGEFTDWRYTSDGSFHLRDQTPTHYADDDVLPSKHVTAIAVAPDGAVWVGTRQGAVRFDGQTWQTVTIADGLPDNHVKDIAIAPDGALWFLTDGGIVRYVPEGLGVTQALPPPAFTPIPTRTPTPTPVPTRTPIPPPPTPTPTQLPDMFQPVVAVDEILPGEFQRLHVTPDGGFWIVTDRAVAQRAQESNTWHVRLTDTDFDPDSDIKYQIVGIDAAGRVWVTSEDTNHIAAWDGATWTTYGADAGWPPVGIEDTWYRVINWGQNDRQGRLWLATSEDVRMFDGEQWTVYHPGDMGMGPPENEELIHDFHLRAMQKTDQIWVGACEWTGPGPVGGRGVRWFDGKNWQGTESPVSSGCAMAIEEDPSGRVWLGVQAVVWRYDPASGDWAQFAPPDDPPDENERWRYGAVTDIDLDAAGDPWVTILLCGGASCDTEVLYHVSDGVWTQVGGLGLYRGTIIEIESTPWFLGSGIHRIEGTMLEMVAPLLIESVAVDGTGTVWFVAWHRGAERLWTIARESGEK